MTGVLALLMIGLVSGNIVCPDGTECQDENTCCPTKKGFACCQYPLAVCCADKAHCCPQGYQCDLAAQQCKIKGLPWQRIFLSPRTPARAEKKTAPAFMLKSGNPSVSVIHCDNTSVCPDGATCCKSPSGQWYCCPYSVGQCCFDGIHCCPFGYHCDSTSTRCSMGALSVPASAQIAAMQKVTSQLSEHKRASSILEKSGNPSVSVIHCDNTSVCPDGATCCKSPSGQWYCCPYSVGQCCFDGIHCCPFGYHCDSTSTRCSMGALSVPASAQIAAMQKDTSQDPCCRDDTGCCPNGFHCDEESKICMSDFNDVL